MDPLSIIASTIAIAGAINAVVQQLQLLGSGRSDLQSLSNEISDLVVMLKAAEEALIDHPSRPALQHDARFIRDLKSIHFRLTSIELAVASWVRESSSWTHPIDPRRLRLILVSRKINAFKDEVHQIRLKLITILDVVGVIKTSHIQLDLQSILLLGAQQIDSQKSIQTRLEENHNDQLRHLERLTALISRSGHQQEHRPLLPEVSLRQENPDRDELSDFGSRSVKAFHHNGSILFDSKQMTAVGIRTAQFSRGPCQPWCSCICHIQRTFSSPNFLERVMGSLFVNYSGIPALRQKCNEQTCQAASQPMFYVTYFFPTWFLSRMISLMVASTPLAGPVVSLKTQRTISGDSEIFICAKTGDIDHMKYLIENGLASPHDVSYTSGITALHFAISYQQMEMCKLLLGLNADPFLEDRSRWTAADNAWGKILSNRFSSKMENQLRSMFSDTEYLERWNFTILHKIVLGLNSKDLERELRSSTAEIDTVDVNLRTPLSFAAERSDLEVMALLLKYGASPHISSPDQGSPLHFAATARDPGGVDILLDHGAEVDSVTAYKQTPLHYVAAYNNSESHTEALISAKADIEFKDADDMTPLHWAAVSGHDAVVKVLLERGANVNATDKSGNSVLSHSIRSNRHSIICLILKQFPDVRHALANDRTILHFIAAYADMETMTLLQSLDFADIDPSICDKDDHTAFDLITARGNNTQELSDAFRLLLCPKNSSPGVEEAFDESWEDAVEYLHYEDT